MSLKRIIDPRSLASYSSMDADEKLQEVSEYLEAMEKAVNEGFASQQKALEDSQEELARERLSAKTALRMQTEPRRESMGTFERQEFTPFSALDIHVARGFLEPSPSLQPKRHLVACSADHHHQHHFHHQLRRLQVICLDRHLAQQPSRVCQVQEEATLRVRHVPALEEAQVYQVPEEVDQSHQVRQVPEEQECQQEPVQVHPPISPPSSRQRSRRSDRSLEPPWNSSIYPSSS